MDARFYNSEEIDLEKVVTDLENMFRAQGYETQQLGTKDQLMVQLKKGGDLAALVGLQTALTLTLQRTSGGVVAMIGQQKWIDKAAVGAVGLVAAPFIPFLWPLMITAGAGAIKQASLGNQVLNTVDALVRQQNPGIQVGPIPGTLMPQFQQYWSSPPPQYTQPQYVPPTPVYAPQAPVYTPPVPVYTPPAPAKPRCPSCNTPYEPGDTFCSGCGRALTPPKNLCPNCKAEIKPGIAFCPKCGANTFQSTASQPAKPAPVPAPTPKPPTPVYTPSKPQTPVYTPPASAAPTVAAQPYVPPTPQEPPVVPQPSVTLVPGKSRPATPPQPPKAPPVPVYIPPKPVQPPTVAATPQTPPPSQTIKARPASGPTSDANMPWGTLTFTNGDSVTLTGERVLIGRYDHDLGGVQPEVDLGTIEGADTVSRGHATLEHIGSTYQLTDLNSTNFSRVNGKRLEPSVPTPINDGDTLQFGKIQCTFKKF